MNSKIFCLFFALGKITRQKKNPMEILNRSDCVHGKKVTFAVTFHQNWKVDPISLSTDVVCQKWKVDPKSLSTAWPAEYWQQQQCLLFNPPWTFTQLFRSDVNFQQSVQKPCLPSVLQNSKYAGLVVCKEDIKVQHQSTL